ncbi:MBL fold metallo-hydrolase [Marinilactibacillus sp. 15R]|nr:MBL fold metallo-hydrolase [Marinilactibacillus sp. 15R]
MIQVRQIVTGTIEENCYIVYKDNKALIIDPGDETSKIKNEIEELEVQPIAILLTHAHFDHIGSLEDIRVDYDIPVYVSPEEKDWLGDPIANLSFNNPFTVTANPAEQLFAPVQKLTIDEFTFEVVPTPGHSPGSVSFIFHENHFVISGDALFRGSVGRTDLPGSQPEVLLDGIRKYLFSLPDDYTVYPGHGRDTTIGNEKHTNPYFN